MWFKKETEYSLINLNKFIKIEMDEDQQTITGYYQSENGDIIDFEIFYGDEEGDALKTFHQIRKSLIE